MEIVDETLRRKFESDWLTGSQPEIADYLPSQGSQMYLPTLEELICIDLEFRWTQSNSPTTRDKNAHQTPPLLEDYLCRYPELGDQDIVRRLIDQEIVARLNSDSPPTHEEYTQRFPGIEILESTFRLAAAQQSTVAHGATAIINMDRNSFPVPFGKYVLVSLLGRGGMGVGLPRNRISVETRSRNQGCQS